ncbi:MAG: hypothetical protein M3Q95_09200 [Bacteroidota bacterium]|nr:hypothetical protein [Bacteroidota bacterium]
MWDGIQVLGNSAASQIIANQGLCETNTGATIANARLGIVAGDATYDEEFEYLVASLNSGVTDAFHRLLLIVHITLAVMKPSLMFYQYRAAINNFPEQFQLRKVDSVGNSLLSKTYIDSLKNIVIYSLIPSIDSNMFIGCYSVNYGTGSRQVFIAKVNLNGDTIWTKTISPLQGQLYYGQYLIETSDHGLLITGAIADSSITDADFFILKTDSLGNYQWMQTYGGNNFDDAFSSVETPDHGFLTLGFTRSFGFGNSGNRDDLLVKWDSLGNYQWHKTYGTIDDEFAIGIVACMDGNYILASDRYTQLPLHSDSRIIKVDVQGNIIWQKQ